ncbi:acyltransferase [Gordonia rhizosphera]|uniref:Putative acyltransferase n=1 Tax=Gordonia rhizosphera NBRC 16068 TaxID=1108045 RepID=K6W592_9ACTN|nr:putative acyltransferase [Gordonia rhizosphera NBRC 16068]
MITVAPTEVRRATIVTEQPATAAQKSGDPDETGASATPDPADPTPPKPRRDKHLYQIDLVRLVTFAGVILDHVILGIATQVNVAAGGVGLLLRYTRYSFFALTGFVLTYQYRHRDLRARTFWRRRYKLIGLPFLVWSLFYWVYGRYETGGVDALQGIFATTGDMTLALKSIAYDLITGNAWYHLYFLSVSMQIYAVFPGVLWLLKRTWGRHRYLLAVSGAFQALMMYLMVRPPLPFFRHGLQGEVWSHLVVTIIPYQFFVLAGCVAAMHYEAFQGFMVRWRWAILAAGAVTITATLVYYTHDVESGESIFRATNVFMLHNSFAYIAIILILYVLGTMWQDRRRAGSVTDTVMRTAADRSFGIYLAHALALAALEPTIHKYIDLPPGLLITVSFIATVALTVFIVEVLRRSPISLITTGRNRIDWRSQNPVRSAVVGVAAVLLGLVLRGVFTMQAGTLVAATGALLIVSAAVVFRHQWANRGHNLYTEIPV